MVVLFPNYALKPSEVDPSFAEECSAAQGAGFEVQLYSHEEVAGGQAARAVKRVAGRSGGEVEAILRGWMLRGEAYGELLESLLAKGCRLVNSRAAYEEAHYLPRAYPLLEGYTPESRWTETGDLDQAWELYQGLRDQDAIVKDHVKSAKHLWREACFIPAGTEEGRFREILRALVVDRGNLFERGFVLRRFVPLVTEGFDMRGHPVVREVRLFLFDGEVLVSPRPEFLPEPTLLEAFLRLARQFRSRFLSLDLAATEAGGWIVVEVGDGGVSGIDVSLPAERFYESLARVSAGKRREG